MTMMTAPHVEDAELVSSRTWRGQQSLDAEVVMRAPSGTLYRASIHRDSYDFQSHARVHTWREANGWTLVLTRTIREVPLIAEHSYVTKGDWEDDAFAACYHLLDLSAQMMGANW